jgi:hypothetical protein
MILKSRSKKVKPFFGTSEKKKAGHLVYFQGVGARIGLGKVLHRVLNVRPRQVGNLSILDKMEGVGRSKIFPLWVRSLERSESPKRRR